MAPSPPEGLTSLSTWERGFVVAAVRALGGRAEAFLAARGAHLAAAGRALGSDAAARARETARLAAAPPDGIERVHPSWWVRPPPATHARGRAYLDRVATAHLVAMVVSPAAALTHRSDGGAVAEASPLAALDQLPAAPLAELVSRLGRRRIAEAFSAAPPGSLAQLCARLGEPSASELLAEARAVRPSHDAVRAAQRSLFKLAVDVADAPSLLAVAGARWLAPALASRGGDLLRRVAQRLPRTVGVALLAERGAPATEEEWAACERAVVELTRPR